jgi:starch phosphorylase
VRDSRLVPERFNKTNGVTPRRWLANPPPARTISEAIGDGWITDLAQLGRLRPLTKDASLRAGFLKAKREAKTRFAEWLRATSGEVVDAASIFDCQVKRIHEYKRQLLNALHIAMLYGRLREEPEPRVRSLTFFFAGKAAPAYAPKPSSSSYQPAGTIDGDLPDA